MYNLNDMIKIDFFKPKESDRNAKVTVHKTGKLGFSKSAADILDLANKRYCKVGKDANGEGNKVLYMVVQPQKDEYSYKVSKAGDYYYLKAKQLLIDLEIDYKDDDTTVIYDIIALNLEGKEYFKLNKRVIEKRKAKQT
jgi:hypothetical protein